MIYAHIENSAVTDTCRVDPATIYPAAYAGQFIEAPDDVERGWAFTDGAFAAPPPEPIESRRGAAWMRIKARRDAQKAGGTAVAGKWYHSDADSRIQQLGLVMMGAGVPAVPWKTMDGSFVPMTQALASQIFQATAASDMALFAHAESLRVAVDAAADPDSIDISAGWPATFEG